MNFHRWNIQWKVRGREQSNPFQKHNLKKYKFPSVEDSVEGENDRTPFKTIISKNIIAGICLLARSILIILNFL